MSHVKGGLLRFSRLGLWYILALCAVATVIVIGQVLIHAHLATQESDSQIVNVAGKQRMLSQKLTKTVLLLRAEQTEAERRPLYQELCRTATLWKVSQEGLLHGNDSLNLTGNNSAEIVSYFNALQPDFDSVYMHAVAILGMLRKDITAPENLIAPHREAILKHEAPFLAGMERVVQQYTAEARLKVTRLSTIEYIVLVISLLVITLEIVYIFRPTVAHVTATVRRLMASERTARKLAKEIGALYTTLERSYEQISLVREPQESPQLYARADQGGNITFITSVYDVLTGNAATGAQRICDLFENTDRDDWMDEVVDTVSDGKLWQGERLFRQINGEQGWLEITIMPVHDAADDVEELLVLGVNITRRRLVEKDMDRQNRAEIARQINQQKFRSVLILEGQEEERKRMAMELHDGIGQMLTSLKYQLELIDVVDTERARRQLGEADALIKLVIKEVRKITFNLKPPVLGDYGLHAALDLFVRETGRLTGMRLLYTAAGEPYRLPQKEESTIFRIIQEAVNNAVKYSGAETITVALDVREHDLVFTVHDDGKGFDIRVVGTGGQGMTSGRGFFNMHERTEYIQGTLLIESLPGRGTTVRLTVPLQPQTGAL